jgi:hypothetical protein
MEIARSVFAEQSISELELLLVLQFTIVSGGSPITLRDLPKDLLNFAGFQNLLDGLPPEKSIPERDVEPLFKTLPQRFRKFTLVWAITAEDPRLVLFSEYGQFWFHNTPTPPDLNAYPPVIYAGYTYVAR